MDSGLLKFLILGVVFKCFHGFVFSQQAHAFHAARQHYNLQLKKKVWLGWHSLIQKHWKVKVERACQSKAEEVCSRLSAEYEAKLEEVNIRICRAC